MNTTKYMRSNHRLDILEMALEHVYEKSINNLGIPFKLLNFHFTEFIINYLLILI